MLLILSCIVSPNTYCQIGNYKNLNANQQIHVLKKLCKRHCHARFGLLLIIDYYYKKFIIGFRFCQCLLKLHGFITRTLFPVDLGVRELFTSKLTCLMLRAFLDLIEDF